jgi:hypothetical protein
MRSPTAHRVAGARLRGGPGRSCAARETTHAWETHGLGSEHSQRAGLSEPPGCSHAAVASGGAVVWSFHGAAGACGLPASLLTDIQASAALRVLGSFGRRREDRGSRRSPTGVGSPTGAQHATPCLLITRWTGSRRGGAPCWEPGDRTLVQESGSLLVNVRCGSSLIGGRAGRREWEGGAWSCAWASTSRVGHPIRRPRR